MQGKQAHLTVAPLVSELSSNSTPYASGPIPRERRPTWFSVTMLAVGTGLVAVALGAWVFIQDGVISSSGSTERRDVALEQTLTILTSPGVVRIPFSASVGRIVLVVGGRGDAVLSLNGIGLAPSGRAYQVWVTPPGTSKASPAGVFDGSERFILLDRPVARGTLVSVTLEDEAGAARPTRIPRLTAVRP